MSWFQCPIKPQICRQWLEKCYPKDKFNKSTRRICLIYFSMTPCIDNIKFPMWNLNINNLMLINFHISIFSIFLSLFSRNDFFRYFDRHSDKTVTLSELLQDINNFSKTIVLVIRKSHEFSFKIVRVITIVVSNPVNFLVNARQWRQSIASWYSMTSRISAILLLSRPSYILYTLVFMVRRDDDGLWDQGFSPKL